MKQNKLILNNQTKMKNKTLYSKKITEDIQKNKQLPATFWSFI